ncbi:hypothetical protein ACFX13_014265 [Malus domestica]|uniref:Uncharacterized protein n=1 Tax=Malus domestica TaxID=3750 RepID=A0A498I4K2_MALDO|nr:hypothetical protein DVH24_019279 [Malus domestica]
MDSVYPFICNGHNLCHFCASTPYLLAMNLPPHCHHHHHRLLTMIASGGQLSVGQRFPEPTGPSMPRVRTPIIHPVVAVPSSPPPPLSHLPFAHVVHAIARPRLMTPTANAQPSLGFQNPNHSHPHPPQLRNPVPFNVDAVAPPSSGGGNGDDEVVEVINIED